MNRTERIQNSIDKVKKKLLSDLESVPDIITKCYECAETEFEESLVDISIDSTFRISSKKELVEKSRKL